MQYRQYSRIHRCPALVVWLCVTAAANQAAAVDLIGYLPEYRMTTPSSYVQNVLPKQLALLDEVRYFGITVNSNGSGALTTSATHRAQIQMVKNMIDALPADQRPRLDIALGGWEMSAGFSTIAATEANRTALAQNIKALLDQTGATSVDIDWEHPVGDVEFSNYGAMLQRIKQEVGPDRRVYATVEPSIFVPLSVFDGPNAIDGVSLMTYELAWWASDAQDLNRGEHSLPEYVVHSLNAWTDSPGTPTPPARSPNPFGFTQGRNAAEENLGIGMPFFGRRIGTVQNPQGGTAYTYGELLTGGWTTSDGNYYTRSGQTAWLPGPNLVEERIEFAHERGVQDVIIWELGQDIDPNNPNSLLRRAYDKRQSLLPVIGDYNGDREVDAADYNLWRLTFGSQIDPRADGNDDGVVDAADYLIWRKAASAGGSAASANVAVPEPHAACVLLGLSLLLFMRRPPAHKRVLSADYSTRC